VPINSGELCFAQKTLPRANPEFFAHQRIAYARLVGSSQCLPFKLRAISFPSRHDTPPSALSRFVGGPKNQGQAK